MIVDSNIFLHIASPEHADSALVLDAFERLSFDARPYLNPVIFAEISPGFGDCSSVERFVAGLGVELVGLTPDDAFRAGHAFREYRHKGGPRTTILPDFLIGAQAAVRGWPILTRDPKRFSTYFPEVELIDPLKTEP
ncbi:MAG TPA: type II toxin-antitoxin system VapC family toxin [Novosphingobium sp.]|nr:type II toxin-antitoxin system VapC family toxin [Novosphingobium sp.]